MEARVQKLSNKTRRVSRRESEEEKNAFMLLLESEHLSGAVNLPIWLKDVMISLQFIGNL